MNTRTTLNALALSGVAVLLSACGSSSGDGDDLELGAAIGVTQSASAANTNYVGLTDEELGDLADVPETETAQLQVFNDFTFDTSRPTAVSMSVPEAIGVSAEVSFCTDYAMSQDGGYDVSYDSCVLTAPLLGGQLQEELNLVNHYTSVLGIVWYQDESIPPLYQEFHFD